jgi:hypothetical protein
VLAWVFQGWLKFLHGSLQSLELFLYMGLETQARAYAG